MFLDIRSKSYIKAVAKHGQWPMMNVSVVPLPWEVSKVNMIR